MAIWPSQQVFGRSQATSSYTSLRASTCQQLDLVCEEGGLQDYSRGLTSQWLCNHDCHALASSWADLESVTKIQAVDHQHRYSPIQMGNADAFHFSSASRHF